MKLNVTLEYTDGDGIVHYQKAHNLVVDGGLTLARDLFIQAPGVTKIDTIRYGTGTTAPAHDDTALEASVYSVLLSVAPTTEDGSGYSSVTFVHYLGAEAGSLGSLTEVGLFSGSTMFARLVFFPILKSTSTIIKSTWVITFIPVTVS
jgi:hypothetical protein